MDLVKIGAQPDEYVKYKDPEDYVKLELNTFPLHYPAPPAIDTGIPEAWLKIMQKYKFSWRIVELCKPLKRKSRKIFGWKPPPPPADDRPVRRKKADPEIQFYTDQMSRAPVRTLEINKKMYHHVLDQAHRRKFRKSITIAWDSIYNYYKKKERDRYLRMLRIQKRQPKEKFIFNRTETLAMPKKVFKPKPKKPKQKKKTFKDCPQCKVHNQEMALPKRRPKIKYNKLGFVKKSALEYLITPRTLNLTKPFERFQKIVPPLPLGVVKKAALLYQISLRTESLATPRKRTDGHGADDEDWNPFAISKWALRYRPTKRMMELSKPIERE